MKEIRVQLDINVIQGNLKVWLVDLRDGSKTEERRRAYVFDKEAPALLSISLGA